MSPVFSTPDFIYFDLGNVLLYFDHAIACKNIARLINRDPLRINALVFESDLQLRYESGALTDEEFHEAICHEFQASCSLSDLKLAASDIFRLNLTIFPVLSQLWRSGARLGILSNTCPAHWEFLQRQRYHMLFDFFELTALSFELHHVKPDQEIFIAAAEMAGVAPPRILFIDDRKDHIAGAKELGIDAILYRDSVTLSRDLLARGLAI